MGALDLRLREIAGDVAKVTKWKRGPGDPKLPPDAEVWSGRGWSYLFLVLGWKGEDGQWRADGTATGSATKTVVRLPHEIALAAFHAARTAK